MDNHDLLNSDCESGKRAKVPGSAAESAAERIAPLLSELLPAIQVWGTEVAIKSANECVVREASEQR